MKHHLLAFGGAAQDYSAGLVTVPPISDGLIRFNSNVIQTTDDWKIWASFVGGDDISQARLNSASLRIRGYPNLTPLNDSHLAGSRPGIYDMRDFPLSLRSMENASLQATNAGAAAAIALLTMSRDNGNMNVNHAGLRKVKFTAAPTSVAYGWSSEVNVTLTDDIEAGRYEVYGMECYEADLIAARLVFKDQVERPGIPGQQLVSDIGSPIYMGGLGVWGTFDSITPPFIQSIHVAAAAQTLNGYLYLGKV